MPLRSGTLLRNDGAWRGRYNAARPLQLAPNAQSTGSAKRERSPPDTSPADLAQQAPASKRRTKSHPRRRPRSTGALSQPQHSEVIDLAGDDDPDGTTTKHPVPRYETRSSKSSGQSHGALQDAMEWPKLKNHVQSAYDHRGENIERGDHMRAGLDAPPQWDNNQNMVANSKQDGAKFKDYDSRMEEDGHTSWVVRNKPVQESRGRGGGSSAMAEVMFTETEAIHVLARMGQGRASHARPAYTLRTGEYISFPVTMSYHLGGMGRYDWTPSQGAVEDSDQTATRDRELAPPKAPRSILRKSNSQAFQDGKAPQRQAVHGKLTAAAKYVFDWGTNYGKSIHEVGQLYIASILASPRLAELLEEHIGLHEALKLYARDNPRLSSPSSSPVLYTLPMRPSTSALKAPAPGVLPARPIASKPNGDLDGVKSKDKVSNDWAAQAYILPFGHYRGRTLRQIPGDYLQELEQTNPNRSDHTGLQAALAFFYDTCPEKYRLDFGKYKGKHLHEVPEEYLSVTECSIGHLRKKEMLQRALWYYNEKVGRSNAKLSKTLNRIAG